MPRQPQQRRHQNLWTCLLRGLSGSQNCQPSEEVPQLWQRLRQTRYYASLHDLIPGHIKSFCATKDGPVRLSRDMEPIDSSTDYKPGLRGCKDCSPERRASPLHYARPFVVAKDAPKVSAPQKVQFLDPLRLYLREDRSRHEVFGFADCYEDNVCLYFYLHVRRTIPRARPKPRRIDTAF